MMQASPLLEPPFKCKVVDFNDEEQGYGHSYPVSSLLPSGRYQNYPRYFNSLIDKSKQKTVYSGFDLVNVINQCKYFAEQNIDFVITSGTESFIDNHGEEVVLSYETLDGEFFPVTYLSPPDGHENNTFLTSIDDLRQAPFQLVYYHMVLDHHSIYGEGRPWGGVPLPFIITFDDEIEDCDDGCPIENGVDAYTGSINQRISTQMPNKRTAEKNRLLLTSLNNIPLDFIYTTDVNSEVKEIEEVNAKWINVQDFRAAPDGKDPYTDSSWDNFNWQEEDPSFVSIWRPNGDKLSFYLQQYNSDIRWQRTNINNTGTLNGEKGVYTYTDKNKNKEFYVNGRRVKSEKNNGSKITYTHRNNILSYEIKKGQVGRESNKIVKENNESGYQYRIEFEGEVYISKFDNSHRLISTQKPTDIEGEFSFIHYQYNEPRNSLLLTSIVDENNEQILSYTYDEFGRVIETTNDSTSLPVLITYGQNDNRTVLHHDGKTLNYQLQNGRVVSTTCPECSSTQDKTFELFGLTKIKTFTDYNGTVTSNMTNPNGLLEFTSKAAESGEIQLVSYVWDFEHNKPKSVVKYQQYLDDAQCNEEELEPWEDCEESEESGVLISKQDFVYDENGWLIKETTNGSRQTRYEYDNFGNVILVDGPRTDVEDITNILYTEKGFKKSLRNALGQTVLNTLSYDLSGRPLMVEDANGRVTEYDYNLRGQIISIISGLEYTTFNYDEAGHISNRNTSGGLNLTYEYDTSSRLIKMTVQDGSSIQLIRDQRGNILKTQFIDAVGIVTYESNNTYTSDSKLASSLGLQSETHITYNDIGSIISQSDTAGDVQTFILDGFEKITEVVDKLQGRTKLIYNPAGNVGTIIDPEEQATHYQYNQFDEVELIISPDTGITSMEYDDAGNLISKTDARGYSTYYQYDEINRVTTRSNSSESIMFYYDEKSNDNYGIGKLTHILEQTGETEITYNQQGMLTKEISHISGSEYTTSYGYDEYSRLDNMTYPSGLIVKYNYNELGLISDIGVVRQNTLNSLASNIQYAPFGPLSHLTFGNGLVLSKDYDTDYRLTDKSISQSNTLKYIYDNKDNVTFITHIFNPDSSQGFSYDKLSRLVNDELNNLQYSYDKIGNRLTKTTPTTTELYQYVLKHRLENVNGIQLTYDESGNTIEKEGVRFEYNQAGRLTNVTQGSSTSIYTYNYQGERVIKEVDGNEIFFIYNPNGQVIAEANELGAITVEYIYFNSEPLALIADGDIYYYHNSHLGTPESITNEEQQTVWRASYNAFGKADVTIESIINNLRFPGQYYDQESGLHYNYFRDYDPELGRYIQSDPIGLAGGINTYGYVGGNPILYIDPLGLDAIVTLYHGSNGNVFNHIGVGTTVGGDKNATFGAGPDSGIGLFSPVPGHIVRDNGKPISTVKIATTPMQDILINQYNQAQINNPNYEYSLLSNSCVDHVRGALDAAGINLPRAPMARDYRAARPGELTVLPNSLFNVLSTLGTVTDY